MSDDAERRRVPDGFVGFCVEGWFMARDASYLIRQMETDAPRWLADLRAAHPDATDVELAACVVPYLPSAYTAYQRAGGDIAMILVMPVDPPGESETNN